MRILTLFSATVFLCLMLSCSAEKSTESQTPEVSSEPVLTEASAATLENTEWALSAYGMADNLTSLGEGLAVTLMLNTEEQKAGGSAGCNNYFGAYTVSGDSLMMPGPFGATMKMCPEPQMVLEKAYLAMLEGAQTYAIEGNTLTISCADGQQMVFATGE